MNEIDDEDWRPRAKNGSLWWCLNLVLLAQLGINWASLINKHRN